MVPRQFSRSAEGSSWPTAAGRAERNYKDTELQGQALEWPDVLDRRIGRRSGPVSGGVVSFDAEERFVYDTVPGSEFSQMALVLDGVAVDQGNASERQPRGTTGGHPP